MLHSQREKIYGMERRLEATFWRLTREFRFVFLLDSAWPSAKPRHPKSWLQLAGPTHVQICGERKQSGGDRLAVRLKISVADQNRLGRVVVLKRRRLENS